ncbi:MAG: DUF2339 domain-containing protein [Paracoccaceae bacterium]
MDEVMLAILAVGALLAIPVCVIILLVGQSKLKARVFALEQKLVNLNSPVSAVATTILATPQPTPLPADPLTSEQPITASAPPELELVAATDTGAVATVDEPAAATDQNRPIVLRRDRASALGGWLSRNWVYVISAASLALAGVFLVQYGIQNGLLPPWLRVVAAYAFGAALIAAGEAMRRKMGDGEDSDTAYLPSVFAGAGIVTLFAATIAAHQLYGLIGPNLSFALHVLTALLAIGLGWVYGPLLVAVGLVGAAAAPFLVGSDSAATPLLYGYYGLIAALGLAVDAMRRWAWVSVLALVLAFAGGWSMLHFGAGEVGWMAFNLALVVLSISLPILRPIPDHPGPTVLTRLLFDNKTVWPNFPVRLGAGTTLVATVALFAIPGTTPMAGLLTCAALTLLALALLIWAEKADGLADLALLPALALPLRVVQDAMQYWPMSSDFASNAIDLRGPETAAPHGVTVIVILATLITGAFAWRALRGGPPSQSNLSLVHGLAAVLVAPATIAALELTWFPATVMGAYPWALHPMMLAAALVALATRFAQSDGADHRRMAYATLSALSLIALSLFLLTSATALTLALAVLILAAAWLDKRYDLREMGLFIQIATAVLSYRLLVDPGLDWAMQASIATVLAAFGGVIVAEVAALYILATRDRILTRGVLESAAMALAAVLANVLLSRWLVPFVSFSGYSAMDYNYAASLNAMPWLVLMLTQLYRAKLGGPLRRLRQVIAVFAGLLAAGGLLIAAVVLNPLLASYPDGVGALVVGPMVLDTLALAYALPGLIMLIAAWRFGPPRWITLGLIVTGGALLALYAGLEIRRFWQGDWLGKPGVSQYELYSYTIALMLVGAALLYQAIARRSALLRRIGMTVIAITVAKVFLIDASGLTGLTRVFSFLGLGLSLAGLAWLNRWAGQVSQKPT